MDDAATGVEAESQASKGGRLLRNSSRHPNKRLKPDHRGVKGRYNYMPGFKRVRSLAVPATTYCDQVTDNFRVFAPKDFRVLA
jgi:hypothetical protein